MTVVQFGLVQPVNPQIENASGGLRGSVTFKLSNTPKAKDLNTFEMLTTQPKGSQVELHVIPGLGTPDAYIRNRDGKLAKPTAAQFEKLIALVEASEPIHTGVPDDGRSLVLHTSRQDYRGAILQVLQNTLIQSLKRLMPPEMLNRHLITLLHAAENNGKSP